MANNFYPYHHPNNCPPLQLYLCWVLLWQTFSTLTTTPTTALPYNYTSIGCCCGRQSLPLPPPQQLPSLTIIPLLGAVVANILYPYHHPNNCPPLQLYLYWVLLWQTISTLNTTPTTALPYNYTSIGCCCGKQFLPLPPPQQLPSLTIIPLLGAVVADILYPYHHPNNCPPLQLYLYWVLLWQTISTFTTTPTTAFPYNYTSIGCCCGRQSLPLPPPQQLPSLTIIPLLGAVVADNLYPYHHSNNCHPLQVYLCWVLLWQTFSTLTTSPTTALPYNYTFVGCCCGRQSLPLPPPQQLPSLTIIPLLGAVVADILYPYHLPNNCLPLQLYLYWVLLWQTFSTFTTTPTTVLPYKYTFIGCCCGKHSLPLPPPQQLPSLTIIPLLGAVVADNLYLYHHPNNCLPLQLYLCWVLLWQTISTLTTSPTTAFPYNYTFIGCCCGRHSLPLPPPQQLPSLTIIPLLGAVVADILYPYHLPNNCLPLQLYLYWVLLWQTFSTFTTTPTTVLPYNYTSIGCCCGRQSLPLPPPQQLSSLTIIPLLGAVVADILYLYHHPNNCPPLQLYLYWVLLWQTISTFTTTPTTALPYNYTSIGCCCGKHSLPLPPPQQLSSLTIIPLLGAVVADNLYLYHHPNNCPPLQLYLYWVLLWQTISTLTTTPTTALPYNYTFIGCCCGKHSLPLTPPQQLSSLTIIPLLGAVVADNLYLYHHPNNYPPLQLYLYWVLLWQTFSTFTTTPTTALPYNYTSIGCCCGKHSLPLPPPQQLPSLTIIPLLGAVVADILYPYHHPNNCPPLQLYLYRVSLWQTVATPAVVRVTK